MPFDRRRERARLSFVPRGAPGKGLRVRCLKTRPGGDPSNLIRVMPAKGRDLLHLRFSGISLAWPRSMTMNKPIAAKDVVPPKVTTGALPGSRKVYSSPQGHKHLRVPFREIALAEGRGAPAVR